MDFLQILACDTDFISILRIVRWIINIICFGIPIVLIVLSIFDIAKIVVAGNIDDKLKKEVTSKIGTRFIYAVIIFLVPTIVSVIFRFIPAGGQGSSGNYTINNLTWKDCWDEAGN